MSRRPRRFWSDEEKRRIVAETRISGVSVSAIARRYRMNANLLFTWLRDPRFAPIEAPAPLLPVDVIDAGSEEVRDATPGSTAVGRIEIELPSGARLRCAADIEPTQLVQLLSALGHAA